MTLFNDETIIILPCLAASLCFYIFFHFSDQIYSFGQSISTYKKKKKKQPNEKKKIKKKIFKSKKNYKKKKKKKKKRQAKNMGEGPRALLCYRKSAAE